MRLVDYHFKKHGRICPFNTAFVLRPRNVFQFKTNKHTVRQPATYTHLHSQS